MQFLALTFLPRPSAAPIAFGPESALEAGRIERRAFWLPYVLRLSALGSGRAEQNLDLQLQALKKAGCRRIFQEKISASTRNRREFQRMLDQIRAGDTIVVWKLDRLARSTRDLLETMETIQQAGGKFQSLSEPWADTTTHAGRMIMTIFFRNRGV